MGEDDRQRVIRQKLARMQDRALTMLATGFPSLDSALGIGGLPRGRIVELFGPASSGKTTLALQIVAHAQEGGAAAAWIDADHSFDPAYAAGLAVVLDAMPVARPDTAEEAIEIIRQLGASGAVDLIVVDSAASLVPRMELETPLGESGPGTQSRVLASGLRKLASTASRSGVVILFLNQARESSAAGEVSAGGPGLKMHSAVRIFLEPAARGVRFRTLKNKVSGAFAEGELHWAGAAGFAKPA